MLALLTARHWPQTLLLTILFLLIAVTTALLACGPVAQPAPADDGALPAAQDSSNDAPPPEPAEPVITPTLVSGRSTAEAPMAAPTNTPIPHQTPLRTDSRFHGHLDPPPPPPTLKYPNIASSPIHQKVIEFEAAQKAAKETSEQEPDPAKISMLVEIELTHNAVEIADWLKERGVSPSYPNDRPVNATDLYIAVNVPLHLMGELSQQEGIKAIHLPPQWDPGY